MKDWKTSLYGILILIAAGAVLLAHVLEPLFKGDWSGVFGAFMTYWPAVLAALGGVGLIHAADSTKPATPTT